MILSPPLTLTPPLTLNIKLKCKDNTILSGLKKKTQLLLALEKYN
jgi:hypothetical protein